MWDVAKTSTPTPIAPSILLLKANDFLQQKEQLQQQMSSASLHTNVSRYAHAYVSLFI